MQKRRQLSREFIARVLERFEAHRKTPELWDAYIASLGHNDEADVAMMIADDRNLDSLALSWYGYPSSDLGDAITDVMCDSYVSIYIEDDADKQTVVTVRSAGEDGQIYEGTGRHEFGWAKTESGRCALADPAHPYSDDQAECVALAVVRAYLNMYAPEPTDG